MILGKNVGVVDTIWVWGMPVFSPPPSGKIH